MATLPRPLFERCLAGDQAALAELVERFRAQVFGLCARMLSQRQDAEDAAQETFVRALRSLRSFDPERDFEPWLFAIAANRCRTLAATRARRLPIAAAVEPWHDEPNRQRAAAHLAEEIQLGLAELRPEHRQAFVLFHEHEMSYPQIAETMRVPVGTVKTWVHRARSHLVGLLRARGVLAEARLAEARHDS